MMWIICQNEHTNQKRENELKRTVSSRDQKQNLGGKLYSTVLEKGGKVLLYKHMPTKCRINRQEVLTVLKSKKQIRSPHFSVVYNDGCGGCTVVISKKIEKLAVNRNKTKRRVFSILYNIINKNNNYVIFVKTKISDKPYKDVQKELESLIIKT